MSSLRSHRDFTPEQIAALKEIEEKARVVRLKQKLISKQDPLSIYKLQDSAFGKVIPLSNPNPHLHLFTLALTLPIRVALVRSSSVNVSPMERRSPSRNSRSFAEAAIACP